MGTIRDLSLPLPYLRASPPPCQWHQSPLSTPPLLSSTRRRSPTPNSVRPIRTMSAWRLPRPPRPPPKAAFAAQERVRATLDALGRERRAATDRPRAPGGEAHLRANSPVKTDTRGADQDHDATIYKAVVVVNLHTQAGTSRTSGHLCPSS